MKKTRYIVVDQNLGVFLGTYAGEDLGLDSEKTFACFAANNPYKLTTACSFKTEEVAEVFINEIFPDHRKKFLNILPVESDAEFPSVVDIIKSGHENYTFNMMDGMFEKDNLRIH
jgi:hypothetical protein